MAEEFNYGTDNQGYQDPIAQQNGTPAKKKVSKATISASIVCLVLVRVLGLLGALICYGGFWAVMAVATNRKMPLAVRIILSIILTLVFIVILCGVEILAATLLYSA
ncbi:MAG: hypothetical protein K2M46_09100 [Lachnospiraceae bacterium]|nr:hypothetical protein [Lachnospiraceae bacterium]